MQVLQLEIAQAAPCHAVGEHIEKRAAVILALQLEDHKTLIVVASSLLYKRMNLATHHPFTVCLVEIHIFADSAKHIVRQACEFAREAKYSKKSRHHGVVQREYCRFIPGGCRAAKHFLAFGNRGVSLRGGAHGAPAENAHWIEAQQCALLHSQPLEWMHIVAEKMHVIQASRRKLRAKCAGCAVFDGQVWEITAQFQKCVFHDIPVFMHF